MFDAFMSRIRGRGPSSFERATLDDLRACYRLFLRREPDPEGWANWKDLVENHHITIQMMVDGFLNGPEFRRLQAEAATPIRIALDGYDLYVRRNDYFIGAAIARDRAYEPHVTAVLRGLLKPGQVFLDIGANIGFFTLLAASIVGPEGHVIAFEPNPQNCDLINQSVETNGFTNVTLHALAAADVAETFALDVGGTNTNGRLLTTQSAPGENEPDQLVVTAVVLDDFLSSLERLHVAKLDIEGAEPRALRGMRELVCRHRPTLLLEFAPALIELTSQVAPRALLDMLDGWGYRVHVLGRDGSVGDRAASAEEVLHAHARSGLSHLDLLGVPSKT